MWAKLKQSVVTEDPPASAWDVVDVDNRDANGKTALLHACEKGNAAECRLLLIQRASPDVCAPDGQSPLYMACRADSFECARMVLFRQRATVNLVTNAGFSPVYTVAQQGNLQLLQLLLEERADVQLNAKDGRTPLYAACERGHDAIVTRLLRLGVPVDAARTGGSTALIAAVRCRHLSLEPAARDLSNSAELIALYVCGVRRRSRRVCIGSRCAAGDVRAHALRAAASRGAGGPDFDGWRRRHGVCQCAQGGAAGRGGDTAARGGQAARGRTRGARRRRAGDGSRASSAANLEWQCGGSRRLRPPVLERVPPRRDRRRQPLCGGGRGVAGRAH